MASVRPRVAVTPTTHDLIAFLHHLVALDDLIVADLAATAARLRGGGGGGGSDLRV